MITWVDQSQLKKLSPSPMVDTKLEELKDPKTTLRALPFSLVTSVLRPLRTLLEKFSKAVVRSRMSELLKTKMDM